MSNDPKNLIERIKKNDSHAFKEFFNEHYGEIFHFLYRHLFDYETAKDLAQETFIKFWEAKNRLDEELNPRAYLFKISKNLAINYSEKKKEVPLTENEEKNYFTLPLKEIELSFFEEDAKKAILELSEQRRTIFLLSRYHEFKYGEIADILDLSEQTVKNQMSNSLSFLRQKLKAYLTNK